jgi:hypothetical protein
VQRTYREDWVAQTPEEAVGMLPAKPLRCRLGRHLWMHETNPDGDPYDRCQRCGEDRLEASVSRDQASAGAVTRAAKNQIRSQVKRHHDDGSSRVVEGGLNTRAGVETRTPPTIGSWTSRGRNNLLEQPRPVEVHHNGTWYRGDLTATLTPGKASSWCMCSVATSAAVSSGCRQLRDSGIGP